MSGFVLKYAVFLKVLTTTTLSEEGHHVNSVLGTSLVAQWIRLHLPMQGVQVGYLVGEPRPPYATRQLSPTATTTEPAYHN